MRTFFKKTLFNNFVSILSKIVIISLILFATMYFIQKTYGLIQYDKTIKKRIEIDYSSKAHYEKPNDLSNYVIINKKCIGCINERKGNAGCVVSKDKKILLVKYRRTNQISLPGGFRDYKHQDTFVATEEMMHSLGYIVSIEDIVGDFSYFFKLSSNNIFRLYKCKIIEETKKTNNKILEEIWVSKQELKDILDKTDKDIAFKNELKLVYDRFGFITK